MQKFHFYKYNKEIIFGSKLNAKGIYFAVEVLLDFFTEIFKRLKILLEFSEPRTKVYIQLQFLRIKINHENKYLSILAPKNSKICNKKLTFSAIEDFLVTCNGKFCHVFVISRGNLKNFVIIFTSPQAELEF